MNEQTQEHTEHQDYQGDKIGMWLFLFTEVILFGGMFLLYSIYRSRFPAEFHHAAKELNMTLGAVNTLVLLLSSFTMAISITAMQRGSRKLSLYMQGVTVACAVLFLVNKYFEWGAKISHDLYPGSEHMATLDHGEILFFSLYYVMTGLHGFHVLAGIGLITFTIWHTKRGHIREDKFTLLENSGLYWHLVDLIWIYLFPLFYLIT